MKYTNIEALKDLTSPDNYIFYYRGANHWYHDFFKIVYTHTEILKRMFQLK